MPPFIWFLASGRSFYLGLGLLGFYLGLFSWTPSLPVRILQWLLLIIAGFLIYLAAMPHSLLMYGVWLLFLIFPALFNKKRKHWLMLAIILTVLLGTEAAMKNKLPPLPRQEHATLAVIGDSVSAGIGGADEQTWPRRLENEHGIHVINAARAGATVQSALQRQMQQVTGENALLVIEIGGNDLLGKTSTPLDAFERDLDTLLAEAVKQAETVVMLELPVLPWQANYTIVQRRLAARYQVVLIPKFILADIFSGEGATSDGIHLTEEGHRHMAETMWAMIGPSMRAGSESN